MTETRAHLLLGFLVVVNLCATVVDLAAQQPDTTAGLGRLADSSWSGFTNQGAFGGPTTIGPELEIANQVQESYFRVPVRVFAPWFAAKKSINDKLGLQFGLNYTAAYLTASDGITNSSVTSSAGGIVDVPVSWTLVGKESGNTGTFALKFENRHIYGANQTVAPMFLGFETGSLLLPATKVNQLTFRFTEMYWQQKLLDNRLHLVAGKLDPTNYYTFYGLIHPFMNFFGYGSSASPSANWPNQGAGVIASAFVTKQLYVMAGLHDAGGDPFTSGEVLYFGDNFFDGKFFKAVEVGFTPGFGEHYFKKISVTYWNSDEYGEPGAISAKGSGVAFASHWFFEEKYIPFLLAGFSDGQGANTLAKSVVTGGIGFRSKSHDILGISQNWTNPPDPALRDQYTTEIYYRFNLTEHLAVTPDLQWVINPSLNPDKGSMFYFGLRARATL